MHNSWSCSGDVVQGSEGGTDETSTRCQNWFVAKQVTQRQGALKLLEKLKKTM